MRRLLLSRSIANSDNNAGSKASIDISLIAKDCGYEEFILFKAKKTRPTVFDLVRGFFRIRKLARQLSCDDVVLIQYPMNRELLGCVYRELGRCNVKTITLIHDVDYLRNVPYRGMGVEAMKGLEVSLLSQSSCLVCHNDSMKAALKKDGVESTFVSLEVFDYLYEGSPAKRKASGPVVVAGNLSRAKAGYLYNEQDDGCYPINLYGGGLDGGFELRGASYKGSYTPKELIRNLEGSFGLVWDGPSVDNCSGDYGRYLRFNNPHKASLYMAAGLPLIVWKEAAIAPFVLSSGVGLAVKSLSEISAVIDSCDYDALCANVDAIGEKIRTGGFARSAIEEAERTITEVGGKNE